MEKRLRLATGLILVAFIVPHLINAALGLWSIEAMDAMRLPSVVLWYSPLGTVLLYGALLTHFFLALWSLYRRQTLRMPPWEAAQLVLGLLIIPLAITHIVGARGAWSFLDVVLTYRQVVTAIWSDGWWTTRQVTLLTIVWLHLCVGLHYWLRIRPWYPNAVWIFYAAAVLIPILALLGFARAAVTAQILNAEPGAMAALFDELNNADPKALAFRAALPNQLLTLYWGLLGLTLFARFLRDRVHSRGMRFCLQHPTSREIRVPVGRSILEALRESGVPHASVCGGRARCTTCRVRIVDGIGDLPPPGALERKTLMRFAAEPNVRLACQVRPTADVSIVPLLPPDASAADARRPGGLQGSERKVAVMFVDLRGSTRLGESKLPYDVVFILNQFFAEMADSLRETDGHYAQFNGDGLMALYGLESGLRAGCREALRGAGEMAERMDRLNRQLKGELSEPLRMGIGIHAGDAIVGTMGPPASPILSAIGDNINIAARLEAKTKDFDCGLVVSQYAVEQAGVELGDLPLRETDVRGRLEPLAVYAIDDPRTVAARLSGPAQAPVAAGSAPMDPQPPKL